MKSLQAILIFLFSVGLMSPTFGQTNGSGGSKVASDTLKTVSTGCVNITKNQWGNKCGDKTSLEIEWTNQCKENYDVKFAIEREGKRFHIGTVTNIKPGDKVFGGQWVCNATGKVQFWARPSDRRTGGDMPSDKDIRTGKAK